MTRLENNFQWIDEVDAHFENLLPLILQNLLSLIWQSYFSPNLATLIFAPLTLSLLGFL